MRPETQALLKSLSERIHAGWLHRTKRKRRVWYTITTPPVRRCPSGSVLRQHVRKHGHEVVRVMA